MDIVIPNPLDILPSRRKKALETAPVPTVTESKVTAATGGAATGVVIAELVRPLVGKLPLPRFVKGIALLLVPVVSSFIAGWLAPHTSREVAS